MQLQEEIIAKTANKKQHRTTLIPIFTFHTRIKCGVCECVHSTLILSTVVRKLAHCFPEYEPALKSLIVLKSTIHSVVRSLKFIAWCAECRRVFCIKLKNKTNFTMKRFIKSTFKQKTHTDREREKPTKIPTVPTNAIEQFRRPRFK